MYIRGLAGVGEDDDPSKLFEVFEVRYEHWLKGRVRRPAEDSRGFEVGNVLSYGCPGLRYAAASFYAEHGGEVNIARAAGQLLTAYGRARGQGQGIVIS